MRANFNARYLIEHQRYINLDTLNARILKFIMYFPWYKLYTTIRARSARPPKA